MHKRNFINDKNISYYASRVDKFKFSNKIKKKWTKNFLIKVDKLWLSGWTNKTKKLNNEWQPCLKRTRYKKTQKRRYRVLYIVWLIYWCLIKFDVCTSLWLTNKFSLLSVIMKKRPLVCQFASPLDVDIHNTPQVRQQQQGIA